LRRGAASGACRVTIRDRIAPGRALELHARAQEVVAGADRARARPLRRAHRVHAGIGARALRLHALLAHGGRLTRGAPPLRSDGRRGVPPARARQLVARARAAAARARRPGPAARRAGPRGAGRARARAARLAARGHSPRRGEQPRPPDRALLSRDRAGRLRAAPPGARPARPLARGREGEQLGEARAPAGRDPPLRAAVLMATILGISAYYHDSAACLVRDGEIVAAAQEERFTRTKHDAGFPVHAVAYCLAEGGVEPSELDYPHSLGMLYSAFTYYTGFKVNSGEYKVMGLAPYGTPRYVDLIYEKLVQLKDDGSFKLNMDFFDYPHGLTMTNGAFDRLFGGPPRRPESRLTQREMDIAASVQVVTEEIVLRMARHVQRETGM